MRFRDLETGVFLTRDPIGYGDGPNKYCYVHCNPITRFDPLGLKMQARDKSKDTAQDFIDDYLDPLGSSYEFEAQNNGMITITPDSLSGSQKKGKEKTDKLIFELIDHDRTMFIVLSPDGNHNGANYANYKGRADAKAKGEMTLDLKAGTGNGTNARIELDKNRSIKVPTYKSSKKKEIKWMKIEAKIAGAHEMIHALRIMNGKAVDDRTEIDNPNFVGDRYTREEGQTVGLIDMPSEITENDIRNEQYKGSKLRAGYNGREPSDDKE